MINNIDSDEETESSSDDSSAIVVREQYISSDDSESDTEVELELSTDSEYDDFDEEYNEIYENDSEHMYSEKTNGQCYIGISKYIYQYNTILMINSVSPGIFFRYSINQILDYLCKYSIIHMQNAKIHIMKLDILQDGTYSVILKTHWLRLIQRHWKRIFKERALIIKKRCFIINLLSREIYGRYPNELNSLPNIYGMLNCYSK
jgi:hypothetical protein